MQTHQNKQKNCSFEIKMNHILRKKQKENEIIKVAQKKRNSKQIYNDTYKKKTKLFT